MPKEAESGTAMPHPRRRHILAYASTAMLAPYAARGQAAPAGHVEVVQGQVTAELASQRRVLAPKAEVFIGDNVATAERSRAGLLLGRDTTLRLGPSTRVTIDRFVMNAGGTLTLESGPLLLDKGSDNPGAPVQVRGAFGLITVRGTRIFVGPSNGVIGIFVVQGLITVTAGGLDFVLQTGEGTNIAGPGARPTPPVLWGEARIRAALASVE